MLSSLPGSVADTAEILQDVCDKVKGSHSHDIHRVVYFEPFAPAALFLRIMVTMVGSSDKPILTGGMTGFILRFLFCTVVCSQPQTSKHSLLFCLRKLIFSVGLAALKWIPGIGLHCLSLLYNACHLPIYLLCGKLQFLQRQKQICMNIWHLL